MFRTTYKIILGLGLLVIIILFIYYARPVTTTDHQTITIGSVLPLNGVLSSVGQFNQEGMELALDDMQTRRSVNGNDIEIIYEDSESNTKQAVAGINKLITVDRVPLVLASASSPETIAISPLAEDNQVALIAAGSAAPVLRYAGDYIFRVKVSVDTETQELMRFTYDELHARTMYILYIQNDYGIGVQQAAEKRFGELGGSVLGSEGFLAEETDFRTYLSKIAAMHPDVVLLAGWPRNNGHILKQAGELNINTQFIAPGGAISPEITEIAGEYSNGLIYITEFDLDSERPAVQTFKQNYIAKYHRDPELFAAMGYDTANLAIQMLELCGTESDCIKNNLYTVNNYEGVSGVISFDEYGDVKKPMIYMIIKNGRHIHYTDRIRK